MRVVLFLGCLFVGVISTCQATPCLFRWSPVTMYTAESCDPQTHPDGCKVQGEVQYRLWYQAPNDPVPQTVLATDATRIQLKACKPGQYFLTAYQADPHVDESDLSEPLNQVQLKAPQERK